MRAHQPTAAIAPMRQAIRARDAGQAVANIRLLADLVSESLAVRRLSMWLLGSFAAIALLLAALGLHGVIAYAVGERTRAIGVRMALGATALDVVSMVGGRGLRLVTTGLVIGLAGAVFFARLIQTQFHGVSPTDPITFGGAALALIVVALMAAWLPARRAARIDPSLALRGN